MTSPSRIDAPARMYNRLFWLHWISYLWAIGAGLWSVWLIVRTVLYCLPGAQQPLSLPTTFDIPAISQHVSYGGSAYVARGTSVTATTVSLTATDVPIVNTVFLGLGDLLAAVTSGALAWCIFLLMRRLRANEPFAASTARSLTAAGLILGIGSTASTIAGTVGHLGLYVAYLDKNGGDGFFSGGGDLIEFMPLFFAGVLFALAGVFRYGTDLEKERTRLEHETDGLV